MFVHNMGTAASSSSKKYDVFISFRGEDTRKNFTSHLHTALWHNSIETYIDYMLQKGDDISESLIQAIQESTISVVVFSENYASSKWCLDELLHILHCKKHMGQIVIPVFYKVDPSHVRKQKGCYEEAFAEHETNFIHNQDKISKWREALLETSNLAGWDSQTYRDESELIQKIVNDVLQKLELGHPSTFEGLVGMDANCECIELLLKKFQIIGIWGMGGIGKTTMAKVVFNKLYFEYDSGCFLENLREKSEEHGLTYVRDELLLELQKERGSAPNVERSAIVMKRRLRNKKVLIVLDDVNSSKQLEYLAQEFNCLGPNSNVIITTRDRHLLIGRVNEIYEVKPLDYQASLKLFNLKAFHEDHSKIGYEQLSKRAIDFAQGVPLALEVLGSFLYSKTEEEWESALNKFTKSPHGDIQEVLKLSYDGLDYEEREMFLDIACFLKGEFREHVKKLLDGFGFNASIGLRTLLDRALITIIDYKVGMHDLIQAMGRKIVRQECMKEPGRRSRLWDFEEIYNVLKNNQGTDVIEGIVFDMSLLSRDMCLSANTFKKMTNLRFLKIHFGTYTRSYKVNLSWDLKSFSNKLSYLRWDNYPLECLPSKFCAEKLVELHMEGSHVKKLWDGVQDLGNLRKVNLGRCENLLELPDFTRAKKLERVDLYHCKSLCNVHPSILSLHTLSFLNLRECERLESLQSEIHLECLEYLTVDSCSNLKVFSLSSEKMSSLNLEYTSIQMLHSSIGRLSNLRKLTIVGSRLMYLPAKEFSWLSSLEDLHIDDCGEAIDEPNLEILFDGLRSLTYLRLRGCSNLSTLPDNMTNLLSLSGLDLEGSNIQSLPSCINHLPNLESIVVRNCYRLRSLPELPPSVNYLDAGNCVSLETVDPLSFSDYDRYRVYRWFVFGNCVNLDVQPLNMAFFQLPRKKSAYRESIEVCYPGSEVPEWFEYKTTGETCITVDIDPPLVGLNGFLFCCVVSELINKDLSYYTLTSKVYVGATSLSKYDDWDFPLMSLDTVRPAEFNSDHVFVWYYPWHVWRNININKISSEFIFNAGLGKTELTPLIKACGVCPIYNNSESHSIQVSSNKWGQSILGDDLLGRPFGNFKCPRKFLGSSGYFSISRINTMC